MKTIYFFVVGLICGLLLTACEPSKKKNSSDPDPVRESDKTRYNINPNDEVRYGIPDTSTKDSIKEDTVIGIEDYPL